MAEKPPSGAKQAAEKVGVVGENDGESPSAAKAGIDSEGFMRGLKTPAPSDVSFSAACKAHPLFSACCGTAEAAPFQCKQSREGESYALIA
jgi:hypothetical protein